MTGDSCKWDAESAILVVSNAYSIYTIQIRRAEGSQMNLEITDLRIVGHVQNDTSQIVTEISGP
jgi:hypothetical protein